MARLAKNPSPIVQKIALMNPKLIRTITTFYPIFVLLAFVSNLLSSPSQDWNYTNQLYQSKNYQQALEGYQKILQTQPSASVHYNLANTYYQLERWGEAIIHYQKALILNPRMESARSNLNQLFENIEASPLPNRWNQKLSQYFSVNEWTLIAVFSGWLFIGLLIFINKSRPLRTFLLLITSASVIFSSIALYTYHYQAKNYFVIVSECSLLQSPAEKSEVFASLTLGDQVTVLDNYSQYYRVQYQGKDAYVSKNYLQNPWQEGTPLE